MINLGDAVYIKGTVQKIELTPSGRKLFYMEEQPDTPITEDNIVTRRSYVNLSASFDTKVKKQLAEYVDLLEKASCLARKLAQAKINLEFCLNHDGESSPTVLASMFANSCDE